MRPRIEIHEGQVFGCQVVLREIEPARYEGAWKTLHVRRRFLCRCNLCGHEAPKFISHLVRVPAPEWCRQCPDG